jgi:hypothetical protein
VIAIAGGGIVTASIGTRIAQLLPGYTLKFALGVFMLCIAPITLSKNQLLELAAQKPSVDDDGSGVSLTNIIKLVGIGCSVGIIAGVFGVGGGAVSVPALSFCLPDISHHEAIGTSLAAMVLPALTGVVSHWRAGSIVVAAAPVLAAGTALGSFLGGRYVALQLDEASLRAIFCILMFGLGSQNIRNAVLLRRTVLQGR